MLQETISKYKVLYESLKAERLSIQNGHGFEHDVTVAAVALVIADDTYTGELAFISALLHSTDHVISNKYTITNKNEMENAIRNYVLEKLHALPSGFLTNEEKSLILEAVVFHGVKNPLNRSEVLHVLQEADMLANMNLDVVIRGGQYRSTIPAINIEYIESIHPLSTYTNPKSVFDAVQLVVSEYPPLFTLPKAIILAKKREGELRQYIESVRRSYRDIDLVNFKI